MKSLSEISFNQGTLLYMAPEILSNLRFSKDYSNKFHKSMQYLQKEEEIKKIDVWALGVVLFKIIYKCHPYHHLI